GPYSRSTVVSPMVEKRSRRSAARSSAGASRSVSQARRRAAHSADRSVMAGTLARGRSVTHARTWSGLGTGVGRAPTEGAATLEDAATARTRRPPRAGHDRTGASHRGPGPATQRAIDDRDPPGLVRQHHHVPGPHQRNRAATDQPNEPVAHRELQHQAPPNASI